MWRGPQSPAPLLSRGEFSLLRIEHKFSRLTSQAYNLLIAKDVYE